MKFLTGLGLGFGIGTGTGWDRKHWERHGTDSMAWHDMVID